MDKRLINTLLRIYHSNESSFAASAGLTAFCRGYNIGRVIGKQIAFSTKDKADLAGVLKGQEKVDASMTTPDSWDGLSRSESLTLASNEKLSGTLVSRDRVAVKALREQPLMVCGQSYRFPPSAELVVDLDDVLYNQIGHTSLLIVENKQTFQDINQVDEALIAFINNPLVVYRGDADSGARADAVNFLIRSTSLDVIAFVDYDPAGLIIAAGLPRLNHIISPSREMLKAILEEYGNADRFMTQIHPVKHAIEELRGSLIMEPCLSEIMAAGKALPQEHFHRRGLP